VLLISALKFVVTECEMLRKYVMMGTISQEMDAQVAK